MATTFEQKKKQENLARIEQLKKNHRDRLAKPTPAQAVVNNAKRQTQQKKDKLYVPATVSKQENKKRDRLNYIVNPNYRQTANVGINNPYKQLDYMTDEERNTVTQFVAGKDYSGAEKYLDSIESLLNSRVAEAEAGRMKEFAKEHNALGLAAATMAGLYKPMGYIEGVGQTLANRITGEDTPIDYNSPAFAGSRLSEAAAEGITEGKSGLEQFLWNTALSMGNQLATAPMRGAALPFMGLQGAADALYDYTKKGIDPAKALLGASGSGAITYATERLMPNELLLGMGDDAGRVLTQGALKHMGKAALGEGVEEIEENILGNVWDSVLMGDKSDFSTLKNQLMEQGLSEEEATKQALFQIYAVNSAVAFAGGALSGGVLGGIGSGANYFRASRLGQQYNDADTVNALMEAAEDTRSDSEAFRLAQKNRAKLENKGSLSNADVYRQVAANEMEFDREAAEQQRLNISQLYNQATGTDGDGMVINSLQKVFSGGQLTNNEAEAIINDEFARQMFTGETGIAIPENATMSEKRRAVKGRAVQIARGNAQPVTFDAPAQQTAEEQSTAEAVESVKRYGESGQKAFMNAVKDMTGERLTAAARDFENYYMAGTADLGMNAVVNRGGLDRAGAYAAYQSGVNDRRFSRKAYDSKTVARNKTPGYDYKASVNIDSRTAANLDKVGKRFGVKITVVDQLEHGDNGKYNMRKGEFVLSAGSKKSLDFIAVHELTHRLRQTSPKEFYDMGKKVLSYMQENNLLTGEAERQARLYGLEEGSIRYDDMLEEVVADFLGNEYDLQSIVDMMADQPKSFVQQMVDFISDIINTLKKAVGMEVQTDRLEEIRTALQGTLRAGAGNKTDVSEGSTDVRSSLSDERYDTETAGKAFDGGEAVMVDDSRYSVKSARHDFIEDGRIIRDLVKYNVMSKSKAEQLQKNVDRVINTVLKNVDILDMNEEYTKDNRPYKSFKPNSDPLYKISLDFSTMCKKRLMTQYLIESLQKKLAEDNPQTKAISAEETLAIRERLLQLRKEYKAIEVACGLCYVEAARLKSPKQINGFLDLKGREKILRKHFAKSNSEFEREINAYKIQMKVENGYDMDRSINSLPSKLKNKINNTVKAKREKYIPTAAEQKIIDAAMGMDNITFLTVDNLTKLSVEYPEIYDAFTSHVRSSTRSKTVESGVPYYYGDSTTQGLTDKLIETMNRENGLRHQSWSDFEVVHLLDTITAICELSIRKAKMHAYTKVPSFVRFAGRTGMLINISLIPEGETGIENGRLVYSPVEGMDYETAVELRDEYPETAGPICIGINDRQINMLLSDDTIDYVIPYHASGMNKKLRGMAKVSGWVNYQNLQTEKEIEGAVNTNGNPDWHKKPEFSEWFILTEADKKKDGVEVMRRAAKRYKQLCKERGLKPKFADTGFIDHENYWKLLIDRKMVNQKTGKIIVQQPVMPEFDFDVIDAILSEEVAKYDSSLKETLAAELHKNWKDGTIKAIEKKLVANEKSNTAVRKRLRKTGLTDQDAMAMAAAVGEGVFKLDNVTDNSVYSQLLKFDASVDEERQSRTNYHAGDLGKRESFGEQNGVRHTGHFGTGTYFLSDRDAFIERKNRPVEKVDFDNYNMFRPITARDGHDLHTALSVVNNLGAEMGRLIELGRKQHYLQSDYEDLLDEYEGDETDANAQAIDKFLLDTGIMDEAELGYNKNKWQDYPRWRLYEEIQKEYFGGFRSYGKIESDYDKSRKAVMILSALFNKSETEIVDLINNAKTAIDSEEGDIYKRDTYSTAFMKSLGYEGIDVSGYKSLDNEAYGSVIYDLKGKDLERKNEIGTARFSRNAERYMELAKNPQANEAELQKMVDEAAKKAGYTIKAYHGSRNTFTVFSKDKRGSNTGTKSSERYFFASDYDTANSYYPFGVLTELAKENPKSYNPEALKNKGKLYSLYIKMENPLVVDVAGYDYSSHKENADAMMEYVEQAEREGNDGIIMYHVKDNNLRPSAEESTNYMFKDPEQAKSADPVTYDNDGNIIPLEERFNAKEPDIRFSRSREEDSGYTVSDQAVKELSKNLIKEYSLNMKTTQLADKLAVALDYMQEGFGDPDFNFDTAVDKIRSVAREMVESASVVSTEYGGEYLEVRDVIRGMKFYLDDKYKADLTGVENYGEFHRKYFGKLPLSKKGSHVDKAYSELNEMYPGLFPDTITHPAEQLEKIAEVYDKVNVVVNPYEGYEADVAETLTWQIYDAYFDMPSTQGETELKQLQTKLRVNRNKLKLSNAEIARLKAEKRKLNRELLYKSKLADHFESELINEVKSNKLVNEILDIATQFKTWYKGGRDVSYLKHPALENYIKELGKIKWRSDIRKASARKIMTVVSKFYTKDVLGDYYEKVVDDRINYVAGNVATDSGDYNESPLDLRELEAVNSVMKAIKKLYQEFDTVNIDGRRQNTRELAKKEYAILDKYGRSDVKTRFFNYLTNKVLTDGLFNVVESRVVYQALEGFHEDGVLTKLHDDMTAGVTKANKLRIDMLKARDEFLKEHKDYRKRLEKEKIKFLGKEMSVGQAITMYLTMHREEAQATLTSFAVGSGLIIRDKKGNVSEIQAISDVQRAIEKLEKLLTKEDKAFAKIARKIFNEDARNVKVAADMDVLGFTNVSQSQNYIPIKRAGDQIAVAFSDVRRMVRDVASVYNFSFNKATVQHSEKAIEIFDINDLLENHCGKVAMYAGLTKPLQNFDRVLNANITIDSDGTKYGEQNLREKLGKIWKPVQRGTSSVGGFHNFHSTLMQDVQSRGRGDSSPVVNKIKSHFASAALGANLKEIISQPTGYLMAYQYLSGEAMTRGAAMANDYDSMMKYSDYAVVRDYDKGYLLSETLVDKVDEFAKKFGEPLDWADKFTMGKLWNACRVEVELTQGAKVGTEENYKAAAELLEKVARLTQPNYDASEKSALQRNRNEIISSFAMFSSVQTKQLSRLAESLTKYYMYKDRAAKEPTEAHIKAAEAAKKEAIRCNAGVLMMNAGYVLICTMVKAALPKKEEEKITDAKDLTKKMASGLMESYVGIIPLADDAANMLIDGYDAGHFFYSSINDMASALRGLKNFEKDPAKALYNLAVATGQLTGIPTRNISNVLKGMINRGASFMDTKGEYEGTKLIFKAFGGEKKASYISLLYQALYDGDADTAKYIINDMVKRGYTKTEITQSLKKLFAENAVAYWQEGDKENLQKVMTALNLAGLTEKNISSQIKTRQKNIIKTDRAIRKIAKKLSEYRNSDAAYKQRHRAELQEDLDKLLAEYQAKGYSKAVVEAAIESRME